MVTGAAGFVGAAASKLLLKQGHKVVGVDNMNDYYDVRVKQHRLKELKLNSNFFFHKVDIENLAALKRIFKKYSFDAIINLAARAGVRASLENPWVYVSTNMMASVNLLELCKDFGVKKFVMASTSSLYSGHPMPFTEDAAVNHPIAPYAASKKGAEAIAHSYHAIYGIDVSIVRYFTVYGPAGRPDMSIFRFIKWIDCGEPLQLTGDGEQSRDFTYIDDIASGTVKALKNVGYEIINLGGGQNPFTMNQVIQMMEEDLGKKATITYLPFPKADVMSTSANIDKAAKLLKWAPKTPLRKGIKKSVEWYLKNKSWVSKLIL